MSEFAKYYFEFLQSFWSNLVAFFASIFSAVGRIFTHDIKMYFSMFGNSLKSFDVVGWLLFIFISAINLVLVVAIVYRVALWLRRYLVVRRQEVAKDKLLEELANLKNQLEKVSVEKSQILALKLGRENSGAFSYSDSNSVATDEKSKNDSASKDVKSRFTKLIALDEKYQRKPAIVNMGERDIISMSALVDQFVNFAASQLKLFYNHNIVRCFFAGMATSKVIIIEGISGTGKTSLPYAIGKFFDNDSKIVSVQPSWRDRAELLGYLNEFTKKFNETDFLSSLYEATHRDDLNFIIIDEMNLARIEYYFAEFLSIMEMPDKTEWKIDLVPSSDKTDPNNVVDGKILVPQNLWFVGTANQDDSTFTITDKVYDRAVSIELNAKCDYFDAPLTLGVNWSFEYLDMLFRKAISQTPLSASILSSLNAIDAFIQTKFRISFGNRILKQMKTFLPVFVSCGGTEEDAFDFMLTSKVLRKLSSLNIAFLTKEIAELIALLKKMFGNNNMQMSIEFLKRLQKNV